MGAKTNAVRVLDGLQIPYELREYEVDLADLTASHEMPVKGFEAGTFYDVELTGRDAHNNIVSKLISDTERKKRAGCERLKCAGERVAL